jgi:ASC-1-like (ASCH) protein
MPNGKSASSTGQVRPMRIYREYFDLIDDGSKTIEVRVAYGGMKKIVAGDTIRFESGNVHCDRKVTRVAQYKSFDEMMKAENPKKIHPTKPAHVQLVDIKKIFPQDKEKLGVLIFELQSC